MNKETFILELEKININITDLQIKQLERYYELLVEWNEKINLTAITKKDDVYLKHFYDSLTLSTVIDLNKENSLCDIGTGAGFPGLVLKILFPNLRVTLIDALNKRIKFLDIVIEELKLTNIKTIHARIEEYGQKNKEMYDIVTARAVTRLPILLEYAISLVKINKYFIPLKSEVKEELENSKAALKILNCSLDEKKELYLPYENSLRTILKFKKNNKTPDAYPRNNKEIKLKSL